MALKVLGQGPGRGLGQAWKHLGQGRRCMLLPKAKRAWRLLLQYTSAWSEFVPRQISTPGPLYSLYMALYNPYMALEALWSLMEPLWTPYGALMEPQGLPYKRASSKILSSLLSPDLPREPPKYKAPEGLIRPYKGL